MNNKITSVALHLAPLLHKIVLILAQFLTFCFQVLV